MEVGDPAGISVGAAGADDAEVHLVKDPPTAAVVLGACGFETASLGRDILRDFTNPFDRIMARPERFRLTATARARHFLPSGSAHRAWTALW
jgi:hypothetical protein